MSESIKSVLAYRESAVESAKRSILGEGFSEGFIDSKLFKWGATAASAVAAGTVRGMVQTVQGIVIGRALDYVLQKVMQSFQDGGNGGGGYGGGGGSDYYGDLPPMPSSQQRDVAGARAVRTEPVVSDSQIRNALIEFMKKNKVSPEESKKVFAAENEIRMKVKEHVKKKALQVGRGGRVRESAQKAQVLAIETYLEAEGNYKKKSVSDLLGHGNKKIFTIDSAEPFGGGGGNPLFRKSKPPEPPKTPEHHTISNPQHSPAEPSKVADLTAKISQKTLRQDVKDSNGTGDKNAVRLQKEEMKANIKKYANEIENSAHEDLGGLHNGVPGHSEEHHEAPHVEKEKIDPSTKWMHDHLQGKAPPKTDGSYKGQFFTTEQKKARKDTERPMWGNNTQKSWRDAHQNPAAMNSSLNPQPVKVGYFDKNPNMMKAAIAVGLISIPLVIMAAKSIIAWWNNRNHPTEKLSDAELRAYIDQNLHLYYKSLTTISQAETDPKFRKRLVNEIFDRTREEENKLARGSFLTKAGILKPISGSRTIEEYKNPTERAIKVVSDTARAGIGMAATGARVMAQEAGRHAVRTAGTIAGNIASNAVNHYTDKAISRVIPGADSSKIKEWTHRGFSSGFGSGGGGGFGGGFGGSASDEKRMIDYGHRLLRDHIDHLASTKNNRKADDIAALWNNASSETRKRIIHNLEDKIERSRHGQPVEWIS